MEDLNKMLEELIDHTSKELAKINKKGDFTITDVEIATKALCLIEKAYELMDGNYSEGGYYMGSYEQPMSYERGRNYRTGRYISRDGFSQAKNNYSGHSVHDRMVAALESMMANAPSDYERQVIEDGIRKLER